MLDMQISRNRDVVTFCGENYAAFFLYNTLTLFFTQRLRPLRTDGCDLLRCRNREIEREIFF